MVPAGTRRVLKPFLFDEFCPFITVFDLMEAKTLTRDEFIAHLIAVDTGIRSDDASQSREFLEIEFPHLTCTVCIPDYENDTSIKHVLATENPTGFTRGELLYQIAQILPDQEWGDHIYFEGLTLSRNVYWLRLGS